uniref:Uncharacterized protein n=1 Tax=viral metagenome TaxID=1070528 RepID=A0A6C0EBZ0_9ZZZZ
MELEYKYSRKAKQSIFNSDDIGSVRYGGSLRSNEYPELTTDTLAHNTHVYLTDADFIETKGQKFNDELINYLEKNYVYRRVNTKHPRHDDSSFACAFEYIVPVTKILPLASTHKQTYFKIKDIVKYVDAEKIKGETVDLEYCYLLKNDKLYKYGKLIPDKITFDDESIKLFNIACYETGCNIVRNANIFYTPHKYFYSNNITSGTYISDDFEIHLEKPSYVNHIATMAEPYIQVYKIAKSHNIVKKTMSSNIVKYEEMNGKDYRYDMVSVVYPERLSWVEDFELLYKDMKTKKWRSLGKFVGNINACDIKLNSFNMVYTDRFWVIPLSIHNGDTCDARSMKVALFGLSTDKIEQHMHYKKYIFHIKATKKLAKKAEMLRKKNLYLDILNKYNHETQKNKQNKHYLDHHRKANGRVNKYPAYNEWKYEQKHIFEDDYDE